jgi:hypothetical protein
MALGRWTSRFLQIIGFAGLIVCLALAVALLLGRSFVAVAIGDVFVTADTSISSGLSSIDDARNRLTGGATSLDDLVGSLGSVPATAAVPAAVAAKVSSVVDTYAPARDRFVAAREQARTALRYVEAASRIVPGITVPTGVNDALVAADDRLTRIDGALNSLRGAARATAGDLAAAATSLRDAATSAVDAASNMRTQVETLQARLVDIHASVDQVIWLGTGALLAVVGYVALLNVLIIWLARRRPKAQPVAEPVAIEASPGQ